MVVVTDQSGPKIMAHVESVENRLDRTYFTPTYFFGFCSFLPTKKSQGVDELLTL